MSVSPDELIFLVTSKNPENDNFGTGFIIDRNSEATYILTCAHVVRDVGGIEQVEIENYSATVIAQSPDSHADDLAVLKIKAHLGNSILPIGNLGKSGSRFTVLGYWLYDRRSKQYRLEQIQGFFGKSVKVKSRYQTGFIDAWQLKIDDDSTLQPGFSGSPVIDSRSYTAIGIVSHLEGQGRLGQAVSLSNLKKIWVEMPPDLFREKTYDLAAVRELLKAVFIDDNRFTSFLAENFSSISRENLPLLLRIEYLVNHCHQYNEVGELLKRIERIAPKHYRKFISQINEDSKYSFSVYEQSHSICRYFRQFIIFRDNQKEISAQLRSQCEIELVFEDISKFKPEVREAAIGALAGVLNISREEIKILEVSNGSVKLRIEVPSSTLDRLVELYETDRVLMHNLGIQYITEVFEESFNLDNIRILLDRGFTRAELVAICDENFISVSESITLESKKSEIVDKLVEYVRQESKIYHLLDLAREQKSQIYAQFSPYYKIPRRPGVTEPSRSRSSRRRSNYSGLTRRETIVAGLLGTIVSALGFIALSFVSTVIWHYMSKSSEILSLFFSAASLLLGDVVGRVVSRAVRRRRSELAGRVAVISYLLGLILFLVIPPLLIPGIHFVFKLFTNFSEAKYFLPDLLKMIGYQLLLVINFLFIDPFNGTSTSVGLAGGGYFAYQRAR